MFGNMFLHVRHKLEHVVLVVESVLELVLVRALELLVLPTVPKMFVIKMFELFLHRPIFRQDRSIFEDRSISISMGIVFD